MTIHIDLNATVHLHDHHHDETIEIFTALGRIESALSTLTEGVHAMSIELDNLESEVAKNTEVDQSAITLLNGLAAQIAALKNDPVKLQALADSLKSSSADLAAAVVANTPAA